MEEEKRGEEEGKRGEEEEEGGGGGGRQNISVALYCVCVLNSWLYQTPGRSSSCSWRDFIMSACCPISPPCRRAGVL